MISDGCHCRLPKCARPALCRLARLVAYDPDTHQAHTVFCGTSIQQVCWPHPPHHARLHHSNQVAQHHHKRGIVLLVNPACAEQAAPSWRQTLLCQACCALPGVCSLFSVCSTLLYSCDLALATADHQGQPVMLLCRCCTLSALFLAASLLEADRCKVGIDSSWLSDVVICKRIAMP